MDRYVRITGHKFAGGLVTNYLGAVGTVISSEDREDGNGMMFSIKIGKFSYLFHEWNIEYITKKEYFKECLSG